MAGEMAAWITSTDRLHHPLWITAWSTLWCQAKECDRWLACILCLYHNCFICGFGFLCGTWTEKCVGVKFQSWVLVDIHGLFSHLSCVFRLYFYLNLCFQFSSLLIKIKADATNYSVTLKSFSIWQTCEVFFSSCKLVKSFRLNYKGLMYFSDSQGYSVLHYL